jgi:hypothetical protein
MPTGDSTAEEILHVKRIANKARYLTHVDAHANAATLLKIATLLDVHSTPLLSYCSVRLYGLLLFQLHVSHKLQPTELVVTSTKWQIHLWLQNYEMEHGRYQTLNTKETSGSKQPMGPINLHANAQGNATARPKYETAHKTCI